VVGEVVLVRVFRVLPRQQQQQKLFKIRIVCQEENLSPKETSNAVGFNRNPPGFKTSKAGKQETQMFPLEN
jgi:hypothetical protein